MKTTRHMNGKTGTSNWNTPFSIMGAILLLMIISGCDGNTNGSTEAKTTKTELYVFGIDNESGAPALDGNFKYYNIEYYYDTKNKMIKFNRVKLRSTREIIQSNIGQFGMKCIGTAFRPQESITKAGLSYFLTGQNAGEGYDITELDKNFDSPDRPLDNVELVGDLSFNKILELAHSNLPGIPYTRLDTVTKSIDAFTLSVSFNVYESNSSKTSVYAKFRFRAGPNR